MHLQVAVPDAKLGAGKPRGDVGVHLGVHVRVDADHHPRGLAHRPGRRRDVVQVKLAVAVHQHLPIHREAQLLRELPIAVEDGPAHSRCDWTRATLKTDSCASAKLNWKGCRNAGRQQNQVS